MNSNFFQYRPPLHLWIVLAYWGKAIYATIYAPLLIVNYYILNSTSVIIYHIVQVVHFLILKMPFRQLLESNHKTIHIWINCLYYCRQMVETDQHYIVTLWYFGWIRFICCTFSLCYYLLHLTYYTRVVYPAGPCNNTYLYLIGFSDI